VSFLVLVYFTSLGVDFNFFLGKRFLLYGFDFSIGLDFGLLAQLIGCVNRKLKAQESGGLKAISHQAVLCVSRREVERRVAAFSGRLPLLLFDGI